MSVDAKRTQSQKEQGLVGSVQQGEQTTRCLNLVVDYLAVEGECVERSTKGAVLVQQCSSLQRASAD